MCSRSGQPLALPLVTAARISVSARVQSPSSIISKPSWNSWVVASIALPAPTRFADSSRCERADAASRPATDANAIIRCALARIGVGPALASVTASCACRRASSIRPNSARISTDTPYQRISVPGATSEAAHMRSILTIMRSSRTVWPVQSR